MSTTMKGGLVARRKDSPSEGHSSIGSTFGSKCADGSDVQKPKACSDEQERCVVHKVGGTGIGKFSNSIVEDIILVEWAMFEERPAGSTLHDILGERFENVRIIIEAIRLDHLQAGKEACSILKDGDDTKLVAYSQAIDAECRNLMKTLESASYLGKVTDKTKDMVVFTGEKLSCLYMSTLLQTRGIQAVYIDLSEVLTLETASRADEKFYSRLSTTIARRILAPGPNVVLVLTGFSGSVPGGLLQEVGRGYADLCTALTAAGLEACEIQIWKEVDGIFTADPQKVTTARVLESITPEEVMKLTYYGSKVVHPLAMHRMIVAGISVRIRNVANLSHQGTLVSCRNGSTDPLIKFFCMRSQYCIWNKRIEPADYATAVTVKRGIAVLSLHSRNHNRPFGFLADIFKILQKHRLSIDLVTTSELHVSMAVHSERAMLSEPNEEHMLIKPAAPQGAISELSQWADTDIMPGVAIITLIGRHLRATTGVSARFFASLAKSGINIEMISQGASEINVSCVIENSFADKALSAVHEDIFLLGGRKGEIQWGSSRERPA